ncbi:MAG: RagB/SusD family nutrient uptake outer membrane protein [Tannerellaceae bacterium]|nr:RagB/SusD family nutrient uptake outer membrane protein [Tannerellaceae bacterium]
MDQDPDTVWSPEEIFNDPNLVKAALANFYGRISWGQHPQDWGAYNRTDEAVNQTQDDINRMDRNWWRVYDYGMVREFNEFIKNVKNATELSEDQKVAFINELRVIRAWYYFCSARSLGGVPIVGDEIFNYTPGTDVTPMQLKRATEAETYDYIIKECREAANALSGAKTVNSARANKWTAKMIEARAALYAGSIARYTTDTRLKLESGAVGIDASKADDYYKIALAAADTVVKYSPYVLQDKREDKSRNFYEAVTIKDENQEVIWARDYFYPGMTHAFTKDNIPYVLMGENSAGEMCVLLNLVEEFEPLQAATPGEKYPFNIGTRENPVFYDEPNGPFIDRDYRLNGTVLVNGSSFRDTEISYQVGWLVKNDKGEWEVKDAFPGTIENGMVVTSVNGPARNNDRLFNKSGFSMLKYLDENPEATTFKESTVFATRFRMAEAYMIACEAAYELGNETAALGYINPVRERAGVKPLQSITLENIIHERRVEFAFEDHRFWDLRRWRIADQVWNNQAPTAQRRGLFAYKVVADGDPNNGKWFFEEVNMNFLYRNPLSFETEHYYAAMDQDWRNKNPNLEPNPFQ